MRERFARLKLSPSLLRAIQARMRRQTQAREFEHFNASVGEYYNMESHAAGAGQPAKRDTRVLAFMIPEEPYSHDRFEWLYKAFEVTDLIHVVLTVWEPEIIALLGAAAPLVRGVGVATEILAPFWLTLKFLSEIGKGDIDNRAKKAKDYSVWGFGLGVVMGADWRNWSYAKDLFWLQEPEDNSWDPQAGVIAQRAFNLGLATGFVQGRKLTKKQRAFFWRSLGHALTPIDMIELDGDRTRWGRREWISAYILFGAKFRKLYVRE